RQGGFGSGLPSVLKRLASGLGRPAVATGQAPVLVLSLPRSGSSWVGNVLGCAPDAIYLREPVTQSDPSFYMKGTVFRIDRGVKPTYERLADRAFAGDAEFPDKVRIYENQWEPGAAEGRRVVVKE